MGDRRQPDETLQTCDDRYRAILDSAMDGFWIVSQQGRILDVNETYCLMSGYSKQEMLSMSIADFDVSETVADAIEHNKKIMEQGGDRFVAQHRRKDGSVFDVEVSTKFIPVDGGLICGFIRDITEQNRAEKALRESEERFRSYVENVNDVVFCLTAEGVFTYVSPNWKEAFGYELDETVGRSFAPFVHPDDVATCVAFLQKVLRTGEKLTNVEYRVIRKDGSLSWYSANGSYLRDAENDQLSFLGIGRDINERKMAEEALAKSERFLKTIIDTEPECIKLLDADCNLLLMNPAGLAMIEADSFEQVKGQCVCPLITAPYRNDFIALTKQVFQGIPGTLTFEAIGLKGRSVWLETHAVPFRNEEGEIVSLLGITRDITERKKNVKALQENKDLLAEIIELSPISMAIVSMDGTIEQINRRAIETFGYSPVEIPHMERWWLQAYPDESYRAEVIARWMGLVGKAIVEKSEIERSEYRVTCKDGTVKTTIIFGIPVADKIFVMFDDITERKRAEEERLSLERQLLQSQKMESLGVLAGGIAHDFNNILTSIVGNTDLALMNINPESPVLDNLKRIEKSAVRATDLARQMLAYSGKGKFVIEALDLNRLVEEMGHMLEVSISKKAQLKYNFTTPLPSVEADATQIRQIVMNLVINASEAIGDENGVIAISTGCIECDRAYLKNAWLNSDLAEGLYVYLEVADTGCGMDKETLAKIFDPFFTTKFSGRGLGMAAVLGIIRGHKGSIQISTEPQKGTTFRILLPASGRQIEKMRCDPENGSWKGSGLVLLVDDEETVRDIGSAMLKKLGFTVITANDGLEALEKFKGNTDICFVILDLTMPQMDGMQCCQELQLIKPDVKVIISSGYSEYEVTQKFAGKGLAGFIQKPYRLTVLREVLTRIQGEQQ